MEEALALSLLTRINTWWSGDSVPASLRQADHRRRDFYVLRDWLDSNRTVITIRGPRQVGKTTVVGQLIDSLLNEREIDPEHILYLNMENSQFLSDPGDTIQQSIDTYENNIIGQSFHRVESPIYIFIDEIQKASDWAATVKYYTDTFAGLQFVVTGSVSTLIDQEANETLVGRLTEFTMYPMKFIEYARYHHEQNGAELNQKARQLRTALREAVITDDASAFTPTLIQTYGLLNPIRPELTSIKDEYLLKGGYPAVLDMNYVDAFNRLDSDIRTTVTGDIPTVFPVQKPDRLLQVLNLVAHSTGQKVSIQSIANTTGLNRETVEDYLHYLGEFFLINRSPKYSTSEYRSGGHEKMYIQDVGHLNTLEGTLSERTLNNGQQMGAVLEAACRDMAGRLQYHLSDSRAGNVAYWDARGEVDLVLSGGDYSLPIEVKRGDSSTKSLRGLQNFVDQFDAAFGLAVNDAGILKEDGNVIHIPAWLFFFMC